MKLTFAFSPCPNDTFMFEPIVSNRIDTEGLEFDIHLADVEELNKSAQESKYDVTKLSFNAYTQLTESYILLNAGSALGRNCGPLLISKNCNEIKDLSNAMVAVPGENTTANFLLSFAYPHLHQRHYVLFSEVEKLVLQDKVDAGVIIHENRFTYQDKGLEKIIDLGEHWEAKTGFPIPLGGIVTRRRFTAGLQQKIDRVIARSVAYALAHPQSGHTFISRHAQEMDADVMKSHIELYVNEYSANIGDDGRDSIEYLFKIHPDVNQADVTRPLFIQSSLADNGTIFLSESYWSSRYDNELTGWDVGTITPPIKNYVDTLTDKSIRILIPGAGNGYEAEYLWNNNFQNFTVCDLSKPPLDNLKERCPKIPINQLIHSDFFDLDGSYDLIIEQTFFCALHPDMREEYVSKVKSLLSENGKLVGLIFNKQFTSDGPPFGGTIDEYKSLFSKHFDNINIVPSKESIEPRKGNEVFIEIH